MESSVWCSGPCWFPRYPRFSLPVTDLDKRYINAVVYVVCGRRKPGSKPLYLCTSRFLLRNFHRCSEMKLISQRMGLFACLKACCPQPTSPHRQQVTQNIINQEGEINAPGGGSGGRAGWMEPGPRALTGPSKLYMKGLCRYRPCADDGGETCLSNGDGGRRGCGRADDRAGPECGKPR